MGVVAFGSLLTFLFGNHDDGSARRLTNVRSRGRNNATLVSGGESPVTDKDSG
jgi:hypothetical protein